MSEDVEKAITTADMIIEGWKKAAIEETVKWEMARRSKAEEDIWKLADALDKHLQDKVNPAIAERKALVSKKLKKKKKSKRRLKS